MEVEHSQTEDETRRQIHSAKEQIALAAAGSHTAAHTIPVPSTSSSTTSASAGGSNRRPFIVKTVVKDGIKEVPQRFEQCEIEELVILIAGMLDRLIKHNDQIPLTQNSLTRFHSRAPPGISVQDYLLRITRFTNVEACCLLILLHYIDKITERLAAFTISSLTVHRFLIAGVACGSKALSDSFCTNGRYAKVGGVSLAEINLLEKEFLAAIDWRLTTSGTLLAQYYTSLVQSNPTFRLAEVEVNHPPNASSIDPDTLSSSGASRNGAAETDQGNIQEHS